MALSDGTRLGSSPRLNSTFPRYQIGSVALLQEDHYERA
jgi:hypothetical protein